MSFVCIVMSSPRMLPGFVLLILANLVPLITCYSMCGQTGNYTSNSTYRANLNTLLSSLSRDVNSSGFYSASVGLASDRANAIVLCRGDVQLDLCRACIVNSTAEVLQSCPNQRQAADWTEFCMVRYSNVTISGNLAMGPRVWWWNTQNVTSADRFEADLRTLLDSLRSQAASGGPLMKVAVGNRTAPDFQTIYSLVQCTPDLSPNDCTSCLINAAQDLPTCCDRRRGARVVSPSCNLRYEIYPFYNETRLQQLLTVPASVPEPQAPSQSPPGNRDNSKTRTIVIVVVSIGSSTIIAVLAIIFLLMKKKQKPQDKLEDKDDISTVESLQYPFETIRAATTDFSDDNKLGQGGFGAVYRGKLENGQEIAVKRLSTDSGQGDLEFKNEVLLLAKLQHRNLVRLFGFTIEGTEKLLVYEYVENRSLDHFLFDQSRRLYLDWNTRFKIIMGIARGLHYLHEDSRLRIIHRDIKPNNVLLDGEMNPKIADFGMARLFVQDETQGNTNRIVGTYGYMSPEYAMHGQFSVKSDVFSFGVIILEIVSGQKNNCFQSGENVGDLLSYAWRNWTEGTAENIIDPCLRSGSGSMTDMLRCIHIGLLCVQEHVADRPTMASLVLMLNSFSLALAMPSKPAFFMHSGYDSDAALLREFNARDLEQTKSSTKSSQSHHSSRADASITELYPR